MLKMNFELFTERQLLVSENDNCGKTLNKHSDISSYSIS